MHLRKLPSLLVLAALAAAALAPSASAAPRLRGVISTMPTQLAGATRTGPAAAGRTMTVGVLLAHPDPRGEDRLLKALYDPASPAYHQFLTPAQYDARFGPSATDTAAVRRWLTAGGLHRPLHEPRRRLPDRDRHRRPGRPPGAHADGDVPARRGDLRRQHGRPARARVAEGAGALGPQHAAALPHAAAPRPARPTSATARRRSCGRSTTSRRTRPAAAPRSRSSARARPTPSSTTCTSSTPRTASPRCPSTSCTRRPTATSPTLGQRRVEHRHAGDPRHGARASPRRSCTSRRRWPTPSSSRRWPTWVNDPPARRS